MQQVAVGGVNLDHVESGGERPLRRAAPNASHHAGDVLSRQSRGIG